MKKFLYIALAALAVSFPSCTDMLESKSFEDIEKEKYMNTPDEATSVLYGVYRNMVTDGIYGYHLSMLFATGEDCTSCEGATTNNFRAIPANFHSASTAEIETSWKNLFGAIFSATDFIERLTDKSASWTQKDKDKADYMIAEAKVLRAMYYFEALRWFGNVPLMTSTAQSKMLPSQYAAADPVDVFTFIETDLTQASEVLLWSYDYNNPFRMSKGSALGLLARVYATWAGAPVNDVSKWQDCANAAEQVVTSKHSLLPVFKDLWLNAANGRWDGSESLIEMSSFTAIMSGQSKLDPVGRAGKWVGVPTGTFGHNGSSAGNIKANYNFLRSWRARGIVGNDTLDKRLPISIVNYRYVNDTLNMTVVKTALVKTYAPDGGQSRNYQNFPTGKWDAQAYVEEANRLNDNNKSNINWYVLRYADVLLLYAEALNELNPNPTADAYTALNQVRRRGYGLPVKTASAVCDYTTANIGTFYSLGTEKANFRQAVRDERAWELCFEGQRKQDLIRWGIYVKAVQDTRHELESWWNDDKNALPNYSQTTGRYTQQRHTLMPIPQTQLDIMGGYDGHNNPGW